MRKKDLPDIEPVVLSERFGMRPGLYITILAILIVFAIFFCLCILPGIISDASYVSFDINGAGIAIYEDGKYIGSSEGSIYRSDAGEHRYEFYAGSFKIGEISEKLPKHVFFTLFHKSIKKINTELVLSSSAKEYMINDYAEKAASWSKVYTHEDKFHIPPFFSEFAENAVSFSFSEQDIREAMIYGAMHVTSEELFSDFENALGILTENGANIDLSSYESTLRSLYSGNGLSSEKPSDLNTYSGKKNGNMISYPPYSDIKMGKSITDGTYPDTNTYPITAATDAFSIAQVAVTEYEYALFVEENPKWAKSNKENLIEEGLVDDGYLEGINLTTRIQSQRPIRAISYYAAVAYTDWLSAETGIAYMLPSEAEWYVAEESVTGKKYYSSLISTDKAGDEPIGMLGQLWEFTSSEYIPLSRVFDYTYEDPYGFDDIIIKGGSYMNSGITGEDVGVISKSETSDYVGFRVVSHE